MKHKSACAFNQTEAECKHNFLCLTESSVHISGDKLRRKTLLFCSVTHWRKGVIQKCHYENVIKNLLPIPKELYSFYPCQVKGIGNKSERTQEQSSAFCRHKKTKKPQPGNTHTLQDTRFPWTTNLGSLSSLTWCLRSGAEQEINPRFPHCQLCHTHRTFKVLPADWDFSKTLSTHELMKSISTAVQRISWHKLEWNSWT